MDGENCVKVLLSLITARAGTAGRIALMELVTSELNADFSSAAFTCMNICDKTLIVNLPKIIPILI